MNKYQAQPKILFFDIETSLIKCYTFRTFKANISPEQIIDDWKIHCAAYQWIDEDEPVGLVGNEKTIIRKLFNVIEQADIVVYYNGDRFDWPRLKTRAFEYGMKPPKQLNNQNKVDLYKIVKREFDFTSKKMDEVLKRLNLGRKIHVGIDLWIRTANGCKDALAEMLEYNKQDVSVMIPLYKKLRPWSRTHPNMNHFSEHEIDLCKNCGSNDLKKHGRSYTNAGWKQRFTCRDCGYRSSGKKTHITNEIR